MTRILDGPGPDELDSFREWFRQVLVALMERGDAFNGKRPLGSSGWQIALEEAIRDAFLDRGLEAPQPPEELCQVYNDLALLLIADPDACAEDTHVGS